MRVEIKSEKEIDTKEKTAASALGSVRIVMNADFFYAVIKHMKKLVKENPDVQKYVIEYNPDTKELFTDVTEANEETNVY